MELNEIEGDDYIEKLTTLRDLGSPNLRINNIDFKINIFEDGDYWVFELDVYPFEKYNSMYSHNLSLHIKNDVREYGAIQRSNTVTGKQIIEVLDEICIWLKLKSCFLIDASSIICNKLNNNNNNKVTVDLAIILLLSDLKTYYEKNGFVPVRKQNDELWDQFLTIGKTRIKDLFSDDELGLLSSIFDNNVSSYNIINSIGNNLKFSIYMTLFEMFKIVKILPCDIQKLILDICDFHKIDDEDCNGYKRWTFDNCGSENWRNVVTLVNNMKISMVKHYVIPYTLDKIIPDTIIGGNKINVFFESIWNKGFETNSIKIRLSIIEVNGTKYCVVVTKDKLNICLYYEDIQKILNSTYTIGLIGNIYKKPPKAIIDSQENRSVIDEISSFLGITNKSLK